MTHMSNADEQDDRWEQFVEEIQSGPIRPFEEHWAAFQEIYSQRRSEDGPPRAWRPRQDRVAESNLGRFMAELGFRSFQELHDWSVKHRAEFWRKVIDRLGIVFSRAPESILDLCNGVEDPRWLPGAKMGCVESCFKASSDEP
ncbi:MAG: acetyl-coenzyme A synthetase N-terminal domain-containing protein, partial [Acidobacteriota bacterium]